ncbi:MAG: hypothetical protein AB7H93_16550 [Vicinamibacterales bacterium]
MNGDPALKFRCPVCGIATPTRVVSVCGPRRRRQCLDCENRFSTVETIVAHQRAEPKHRPRHVAKRRGRPPAVLHHVAARRSA